MVYRDSKSRGSVYDADTFVLGARRGLVLRGEGRWEERVGVVSVDGAEGEGCRRGRWDIDGGVVEDGVLFLLLRRK